MRRFCRVLEIGCGVGRMTRVLPARSARVVGLDVSDRMLEIARQQNPGISYVEWRLGDGSSLAEPNRAARTRAPVQSSPGAAALLGRARRGQADRRWLGSMIELDAPHAAAADGCMPIERIRS
jgi:SAM-dependent methyltransferase